VKHVNIRVEGRVQCVGFRWAARARANLLGVSGFVRNEDDGAVCLEAEGPEPAVDQFVAWCRHGPPSAVVERLEVQPGPVAGFARFDIRME
jgi:acylphosphatase